MNANTTATTTPRRPNATTQRARLAEQGRPVPDAATPADLKAAWFAAFAHDGKAWTPIAPATPPVSLVRNTPKRRRPATPATPAPVVSPANFPLCGCGCGVPTVTAKARFLSGHDARFAGMVGRGEIVLTQDDPRRMVITAPLQAKIDKIAATAAKRAAEKAAKKAAKAAAQAAYDAHLAAATA